MPYASCVHASVTLPPEPRSPRAARRFVADALSSWHGEHWEAAAALLVTELVTNAVLHARTPITVQLVQAGARLRIEVSDGSPRRPAPRAYDVDATTGRGLALVERLGSRWGVELKAQGKTVWVELSEVTWQPLFELDEEPGVTPLPGRVPQDRGAGPLAAGSRAAHPVGGVGKANVRDTGYGRAPTAPQQKPA